ncbi:type I DNA topoisomerase [Trebonia kvetii]|uniref:DNA topoisomerase 1 n=1 Tax=Trebonia kvetii TaxID=2480626 RepID=A0A6P2BPA4_9ACTN|nr:type I DNA topoisomerase [Trebonia kvetii]
MPARSRAAGKTAAASENGDNGAATGNNGAAVNGNGRGTRLVIVESPAKARTIAGYLGKGYVVESSIGHIRDMPDKAAEIPEKYRAQPWARLGVDVDNDFQALYVVPSDKKQQVSKLKSLLKDADELYLATDEDREGEAIAWHLREELKPKVPTKRMVFHEITPEAIARAIANPTELNDGKVDAYQTRRVLDRLYGYEVSPVLWKKVMPRLSAGRVQSVATRLVVDRERERIAFRSASYWDLEADFATAKHGTERLPDDPTMFTATLQSVDGKRVAQGRDFTSTGQLRDAAQVLHLDGESAGALAGRLRDASFSVSSVERKPYRRSPYAPFRTTTLQQEASRKLGFTAKYAMSVAQRLYEEGFITYMRTDSITLSQTAIDAARSQARELYGADYVPDAPRTYASKVKNAQEAHEAIRPAGDRFRTPAQAAKAGLRGDHLRLYDLIWKRTVACQMKDATGESVSVKVAGNSTAGERAEFGASGKIITFYGFLKAYVESTDDTAADRDDQERRLPVLAENDPLTALRLDPAEHATRPPARYTEASLVKELEDREIGRPSTYASIIGTILDRGYVFKKGTALVPSFLAFAVITLLERHFGQLVDYEFTAQMEDALDEIARGEAERVPWLRRFYFGDDAQENAVPTTHTRPRSDEGLGLKALVSDITDIDARDVSSFPLAGTDIVVRVGRYGPYLERDGERANVPEDLAPDELTPEKAEELLSEPSGDKPLGSDPESGHQLVAKAGRFGPYVTEVLPEGAKDKPRTASLLKSMTLDTVTLDDALKLLSLPRTLGEVDGEPVTVQNGRYGPYVKRGAESRSLATEEDMFTISFDQAKALLAEPKPRGRGRAAAAPPLRELGNDPASGKPMVIKDGRFGPYVTDGETNASLRKGDEVATITVERAAELLADRRAAAPAPRAKRTTAAKPKAATTKATTTKKAATTKKATTAKKPAAKKSAE